MAHRVNTKFLAILSGILVLLAGGVAVAYVMLQKNAEEHYELGEEALAAGDYAEARRSFGAAISEAPAWLEAYESYRDVLDIAPVATITDAQKYAQDYRATLARIVELKPGDAEALTDLFSYIEETFGTSAATAIHELATRQLELNPDNLTAQLYRGVAVAKAPSQFPARQLRSQVESDLMAVLNSEPENGLALYALALWRQEEGRDLAQDGLVDAAKEKFLEANQIAMSLLAINSDDLQLQRWSGEIYMRSLGEHVKFRQIILPKHLELVERNAIAMVDDVELSRAIIEAAGLVQASDSQPLRMGGSTGIVLRGQSRAVAILEALDRAQPNRPEILIRLAALYEQLGEPDQAAETYQKLVDLSTNEANFIEFLSVYNRASNARYQVARIKLRAVLEGNDDPSVMAANVTGANAAIEQLTIDLGDANHPLVRHLRGLVALVEGDNPTALRELDQAVTLTQQTNANILNDAFLAAVRNNRSGLALNWLERYVSINRADILRRTQLADLYLQEAARGNPTRNFYDEAEEQGRMLKALAPGLPVGRWITARALANGQNDFEGAINEIGDLDAVLAMGESESRVIREYVGWLRDSGRTEDANELISRRFASTPSDVENAASYAMLLESDEDKQAVIDTVAAAGVDSETIDRLTIWILGTAEDRGGLIPSPTVDPIDNLIRRMEVAASIQDWDLLSELADAVIAEAPSNERAWQSKLLATFEIEGIEAARVVSRAANDATGNRAQGNYWNGQVAFLDDQLDRAQVLFERVIEQDPTYTSTHTALGHVFLKLDRPMDAAESFDRAISTGSMSQSRRPLLGLATASQMRNDEDGVLRALRAMHQNNLFVQLNEYINYISIEQQYGDDPERARTLRDNLVQRYPQLYELRRQIALEQANNDNLSGARTTLEAIIAEEGDTLANQLTMAELDQIAGDPQAGRTRLETYVAAQPLETRGSSQLALAEYLLKTGETGAASAAYEEARRLESPDRRQATRLLASRLYSMGQFGQASALLDELHTSFPEDAQITRLLIDALTNSGQLDRALEVSSSLPLDSAQRWSIQSQHAIAQGNAEEAIAMLDEALTNLSGESGRSGLLEIRAQAKLTVMRQMGLNAGNPDQTEEFERRMDDARLDLEEAIAVQPNNFSARALQAELEAQANPSQGQSAMRRVVRDSNGQASFRQRLIRMLMADGNLRDAVAEAEAGLEAAPESVQWMRIVGDLYRQSGDTAGAASLLASVARQTGNDNDVIQATEAALAVGDAASVAEFAEQHVALFDRPVYKALRAAGLAIGGNRTGAVNVFRIALSNAASDEEFVVISQRIVSSLDANEAMASIQATSGKPEAWRILSVAIMALTGGQYETALQMMRPLLDHEDLSNFGKNRVTSGLGLAYQQTGESELARQAYEMHLQRNPNDWHSMNNLAYLLVDKLDEPEAALPFAENASLLSGGDQPAIEDTLGLIYLRLNRLQDARSVLQRVVEKTDTLPTAYLHLGEVYMLLNDRRTTTTLQRAIQSAEQANDTATAEAARRMLREANAAG